MKRILHVVNIYFTIPYFLGQQLNYFANKGHKMHIVCSPSAELRNNAAKYNYSYKEIAILREIAILKDICAVIKTAIYIRKNKIDIVTGNTPKGGLIAMMAAFIAGVPNRIYFRHGLVYETSGGLKRFILKSLDRITATLSTKVICVSESVCKQSIIDGLNSEKKQALLRKGTCNGIDTNRFDKTKIKKERIIEFKRQTNIPEEAFVIGFTGRLVVDKGIIELVEAFNILQRSNNNIYLLLVGMLEKRDALPKEIIDIINNNPSIICTGYVDYNSIEYFYAMMDIFILPSYREGFPTSVLEASSFSLPVVTTKATGCIDSIVENVTGIFVNHTASEISNAIELLIHDQSKRESLGRNGRDFVVNNFRQELIWKEIEKLYL